MNRPNFHRPDKSVTSRRQRRSEPMPMNDFPRIRRLPPYVFNITGELKAAARSRGEDVIDMSMGNRMG